MSKNQPKRGVVVNAETDPATLRGKAFDWIIVEEKAYDATGTLTEEWLRRAAERMSSQVACYCYFNRDQRLVQCGTCKEIRYE